jgi:hypothetical protein
VVEFRVFSQINLQLGVDYNRESFIIASWLKQGGEAMEIETALHIAHAVGEHNEHIANITNTLFAISLLHGGTHVLHVHIRRFRAKRRARKEAAKSED